VSDRRIVVSIELSETLFADTVWVVESLKREIESDFLARLNVEAEIHWVNPRSKAVPETYMEDVSPPPSSKDSSAKKT
jgi:hypothetical protein